MGEEIEGREVEFDWSSQERSYTSGPGRVDELSPRSPRNIAAKAESVGETFSIPPV